MTLRGKIEVVNDSKSGKTLSVNIGGQWYSTKGWEFRQMVGQTIEFEPSSSEWQGQMMHWINDYNVVQPTAEDAMQAAQPPSPPMDGAQERVAEAQTMPNKDSVIGAMALCKCCTPGTPEQAFSNFVFLYHKLNGWDHTIPY